MIEVYACERFLGTELRILGDRVDVMVATDVW